MTDTRPSPLLVEICPDGSILLQGELDMATAKQVEDAIAEVMRPGRPVVIDMAQVSFIDSSGVRVLARTYQQTGERVVIWNPSRWVWSVLEIIDAKAKPEAWVIHAD
jgi:anti-anti-sigma factor